MRAILVLLRKDFSLFLGNKVAVSLTFIIPAALIYLFGQIFGLGGKGDSGPNGIPIAVVVQSDNPAATDLLTALKGEKSFRVIDTQTAADGTVHRLTEDEARAGIKANDYRFALIIPTDLLPADSLGVHLKLLSDPRNEIETQTVNGLLQKTIFSNVPQLLGSSLQNRMKADLGDSRYRQFNQNLVNAISSAYPDADREKLSRDIQSADFGLRRLDTPAAEAATTGNASPAPAKGADGFSKLINFENEQVAGLDVSNPAATRVVGGWAVQFLLFAVSASAVLLFDEKQQGLFQRLLSGPVRRSHILWSKFLYGVLLGLIQLITLYFAGHVLYGIDIFSHFGNLVIVSIAAAAACTSFGMLIASLASSPEAARGMATFTILLMSAIGGAWFPTSFMPDFIQQISKLTVVYWSMEGFLRVLWAQASFMEVLPVVGILTGITAVVMGISVWRFNRSRLFD